MLPDAVDLKWYGVASGKINSVVAGSKMYCPLFMFPCRIGHFSFHFETFYRFVHQSTFITYTNMSEFN